MGNQALASPTQPNIPSDVSLSQVDAVPSATAECDDRCQTFKQIHRWNATSPVMIYSKTQCFYCTEVKKLISKEYPEVARTSMRSLELDTISQGVQVHTALKELTGQRTVPNVFINGQHIGGCADAIKLHESGKLAEMLSKKRSSA